MDVETLMDGELYCKKLQSRLLRCTSSVADS